MLKWFLTTRAVNALQVAILSLFGVVIWVDTTMPSALTGIFDELAYGGLVGLQSWLLKKQRDYLLEGKKNGNS